MIRNNPAKQKLWGGEKVIRIIVKRKKGLKIAVLLTAILAWSIGMGPACDMLESSLLKSAPGFRAAEAGEKGFIEDDFDGIGRIGRIGKTEIVIDDSLKKLSRSVDYHSQTNDSISRSRFRVGKNVGYRINVQGEVTGLWLFDD